MINVEYHLDNEMVEITTTHFIIGLRLPLSFELEKMIETELLLSKSKKNGFIKFSLKPKMDIKYKISFNNKHNNIFNEIKKASNS